MSRDAALFSLAELGQPGGRVYGWTGACVSLGRFQVRERAVLACSLPTVQRPTGGKAVLHGHDVTLGLALPLVWLGLDSAGRRSVAQVYRAIAGLVVPCLQEAGVTAELGENTRFVRDGRHFSDCFAVVSPNDIVDPVTGQKVCGCALRIGDSAVLLQASIPAGPPLVDPRSIFAEPGPTSWRPVDASHFAESLDAALFDLRNRAYESPVS